MFKLVVLAAVLGVTLAQSPNFRILRQRQEIDPNGSYNWSFETENGINAAEQGSVRSVPSIPTPQDALRAEGSYSYTSPEGVPISVTYVADENGFQPISDSIPKVPEYILRALEWQKNHPNQ